MLSRLLPNRSPVAWGSQRIALGALIFHSNTFHFICWAPKFSAFSSEGPLKIFLGSSLGCNLSFNDQLCNIHSMYGCYLELVLQ